MLSISHDFYYLRVKMTPFLLSLVFIFSVSQISATANAEENDQISYLGFKSVFYPMDSPDLLSPPLTLKQAAKSRPITKRKFLNPRIDGSHRFRGNAIANGCADAVQEPVFCDFGNIESDKNVLLIGGSHMGHLVDGFLEAFDPRIWKITTVLKRSCRFKDFQKETPGTFSTDCAAWSANVLEYVTANRSEAIVMLGTTSYTNGREDSTRGLRSMIRLVSNISDNLILVRDTPRFPRSHVKCLQAKPKQEISDCVFELNKDFELKNNPKFGLVENANTAVIHLNPYICFNFKCPAAVSNVLIYRDNDHLTPTFAKQLAPVIAFQIKGQLPELALTE
jgi:hypothetical protein